MKKATKKLEALAARLKEIQSYKVQVGVFSNAQHPLGGGTIAEVATRNHFGAPGVPARPFLSIAAVQSARFIADVWKRELTSDHTPQEVFDAVGTAQVTAVRETILDRKVPPPNAASTIKRKQSDIPLVDSETLLDHIEYKVVKK